MFVFAFLLDDHCIKLLQAGVLPHIVKLFPATDAREQHAALGALKNLSIPGKKNICILNCEGVVFFSSPLSFFLYIYLLTFFLKKNYHLYTAENKEKILDAEMLEGLKALLHSPHDAIQFLAVSTLRVLSTRTSKFY